MLQNGGFKKTICLTLAIMLLISTVFPGLSTTRRTAYAESGVSIVFTPKENLQGVIEADTRVGTLGATGTDGSLTFTLVEESGDNDLFVIDGTNVLVAPEAQLIPHSEPYSLHVRATYQDDGEKTVDGDVYIYVAGLVFAQTPELYDDQAIDGTTVGTIGVLLIAEPYQIGLVQGAEGKDNDNFRLEGNSVIVNTTETDGLSAAIYAVVVTLSSDDGTLQQEFTVNVRESIPVANLQFHATPNLREADNVSPGSTVGVLSAEGGVGNITFALVAGSGSTHNDRFVIVGSEVKVAQNVVLLAETYLLRVKALAAAGTPLEAEFSVTVAAPAPPGNNHRSDSRVYLWSAVHNGPAPGRVFTEIKTAAGGENYGHARKAADGRMDIFARPERRNVRNVTATTTYEVKNVNLTGVRQVWITWRNTGSNNTHHNKSTLQIVGGESVVRWGAFGQGSQALDAKALSGNHDIRVSAQGYWRASSRDLYNSQIFVDDLWLVMEQYSVTINATSGGTITGRGGIYNYGESPGFTAVPNPGYEFVRWRLGANTTHSTNASTNVFVNGAKSLTAEFKPKAITVTVDTDGSGTISGEGFTANPDGTLQATVDYGTQVTLTAIPEEGYAFDGWTSTVSGLTSNETEWSFFVPANNLTITGYFKPAYDISASVEPSAGGSVTGAGIYPEGSIITLIATSAPGHEFVSWTEDSEIVTNEDGETVGSQYVFNAAEHRSLVANFRLRTETITVAANPAWAGTVSGAGSYQWGTPVAAVAVPREDYQFVSWTANGEVVSQNANFSFQVADSLNLGANFVLRPGTFTAQPHTQFVGHSVSFDATRVYAYGNQSYSYHWSFGDGGTASGMTANHTYSQTGEYEVTLQVRDSGQLLVERKRTITIAPLLPLEQAQFQASPQGVVRARPGTSVSWEVSLISGGVPLASRQITVQDELAGTVATITTDRYGMASYSTTVPTGTAEFSLKPVSFSIESLRINRGVQVFDTNVRLGGKVFDHFTGKPLAGVLVSVIHGGATTTARTDARGDYSLTGLTSGNATVNVTVDKYQAQSRTVELSGLNVLHNVSLHRIIPGTTPVIGRLYSEATDSTSRRDTFFTPPQDRNLTFRVDVDWRQGHEPGHFVFITPRGEHTVAASVGQNTFNLKDLHPGDRLQVKAVTAHGVESNIVDAGFEITKPSPISPNTTSFTLPSFESAPIGSSGASGLGAASFMDLPFIGGSTMSLDLGNVPVEVEFDEENGQVTAFIGWKILDKSSGPDDSNVDKMKRLWSELKKGRAEGSPKKGEKMAAAEVVVGGRFTFAYNDDVEAKEWQFQSGYITVVATGEVGYTVYYMTPVLIPLYGQIRGGLSVTAELGVEWIVEVEELELRGTLTPEVYVRVAVGAGIADTLSAEGWAKALGGMDISLWPERSIERKYIELSTGYKITLLVYTYEQTLWNREWEWLPEDESASGQLFAMSMPEVNEMQPMSRAYLEEGSTWMPVTFKAMASGPANVDEITMQSNIFPHPEPQLVRTDEGMVMVWVSDDPARSGLNRTSLAYSRFDGQQWSYPRFVADDGTADFYPHMVRTQDGVLLTWVNNAAVLEEGTSIADYLRAGEIAVGFYNAGTDSWHGVANLTDNDHRDSAPKAAAHDDKAMVVWTRNPDDAEHSGSTNLNEILYSQPDDIMFSLWDGNTWSPAEIAVSGVGAIVNSSLSYDGSTAVYAYTVDADNNLDTRDDQELYIITHSEETGWTTPQRITNNAVQDASPQLVQLSDGVRLFWYQDGKILSVNPLQISSPRTIIAGEATSALADFTLATGDDGAMSIVWAEGVGEAQEIFATVYDRGNDSWSGKVQLTNNGAINRSIDATLDPAGNVLAVYGKRSVVLDSDTEMIVSDHTDLTFATLTVGWDVSIVADDISLSEANPLPGTSVTVNATVRNLGELAARDLEVAFYDGDPAQRGTPIGSTQTIAGVLEAGSEAVVSTTWDIPEGFTSRELYVVVDPFNRVTDRDRDNNSASIRVINPDLAVEAADWYPMGDDSYIVTARLANRGFAPANGVELHLYRINPDFSLTPLQSENVGHLAPGQELDAGFLWSPVNGNFRDGLASLMVIATSADDVYTTGGNTGSVLIRQLRAFAGGAVTDVQLNKTTLTLSEGERESLVEALNPLDATNRSVTWSSADSAVAVVDANGLVTAVGVGTTAITVTHTESGLTATCEVTVLRPPVLTLVGPATIQLISGETYVEEGATATEAEEGDLNDTVTIGGDTVNTNMPGTYAVTYDVTGSGGNRAATVTRTVTVVPRAPVASGSEGGLRSLAVTEVMPSATLQLRNQQNSVVRTVTLAGTATSHTFTGVPIGEGYTITQVVNGMASVLSNAVNVGPDVTPPVLTLLGDDRVEIVVGDTYNDAGATALDELDGDITHRVSVTGLPDVSRPGIYVGRYNVSDFAGNRATEATRTVIVAPLPVRATGGANMVRVHDAFPGASLMLHHSMGTIVATATATQNGDGWIYGVQAGSDYYVVQTVDGASSAPSDPINVHDEPIPSSPVTTVIRTNDDRHLNDRLAFSGEASIDVSLRVNPVAELSDSVVGVLTQQNRPLRVIGRGAELSFPPGALSAVSSQPQSTVLLGAREVSQAERQDILMKAPPGESTGLFEVGGKIFDLTAQLRSGLTTERIQEFGTLVAVTMDLSHLGQLTEEQIRQLVGVRLEVDDAGEVVPVTLGGSHDPVKQTFTFYTERFSVYTVMRYTGVKPEEPVEPEEPGDEKSLVILFTIGGHRATVNGKDLVLDVPPIAVNGRTLVPVRFVAETMGAEVDWIQETETVIVVLDGVEIRLAVGELDPASGLDVPAQIRNGRTLVPIRWISERLGATVEWYEETDVVEIVRK